MAGISRMLFCVLLTMSFGASSATAFGGRLFGWGGSTTTHYYYASPAYGSMPYMYCPPYASPSPMVIPVPDARPTPAPPSQTGEPPLQKKASYDPRMPVIVTSHASGGNYSTGSTPLAKDRCRIGFWNLTGRDITLTVDGKSWKLAKDRALTLDLPHQFTWQADGRLQHVERIAEGQTSQEIAIRE